MTHIAARLVADRLADPLQGIGAVLAVLPRDGTDPKPTVGSVMSELSIGANWIARGQAPREGADLAYPVIAVRVADMGREGGTPVRGTAVTYAPGTVTVEIFVLVQDPDTAEGAIAAAYLLPAIAGALYLLDVDTDTARTRAYATLEPSTAIECGRPDFAFGDVDVVGAVRVTYPVREALPTTV